MAKKTMMRVEMLRDTLGEDENEEGRKTILQAARKGEKPRVYEVSTKFGNWLIYKGKAKAAKDGAKAEDPVDPHTITTDKLPKAS